MLSFNWDELKPEPTKPSNRFVQQFPSKTSSSLILANMVDVRTELLAAIS